MSDEERPLHPDAVAIIGMAGRFPGARNVREFWEQIRAGQETIDHFADGEMDPSVPEELRADPAYVRARGVLEDAERFDARFFGINPMEARMLDPQHRVFLETAWEALEDAGYDSDRFKGPIGVFGGAGFNTYFVHHVLPNQQLLRTVGEHRASLANAPDYITTRVSYKLNLKGPSISLYTGCSTSLIAVAQALDSLLSFQSDMALAGGSFVWCPQRSGYLYQEGEIFAKDGHCRPFDAGASGTVFSNGVGLVVLKRLEDAVADRDHIYAVIRGAGVNNDGSDKVSFTAPSVDAQADVVALAMANAGVSPDTITYLEAHGTGTRLGDPIEVQALTKAFRRGTERTGFCAIGSLKANLGHLDAAAGVAGLMKAALALKHRAIPPSVNFETENPEIGFEKTPFYVNRELREWATDGVPRRAGVTSLGVGGTNVHVVLEEAPEVKASADGRPWHLLTLSARGPEALDQAAERLASFMEASPGVSLADCAFTLQVGRRRFSHHLTAIASSQEEAVARLREGDPQFVRRRTSEAVDTPVVFMFTGQGAQYADMARGLYEGESVFRDEVDRIATLLEPELGLDLRTLLFPDQGEREEADEKLRGTRFTQPALFAVEFALASLWRAWGVEPQSLIGHSIGEYTAACLSGVFTLEDCTRLVAIRGRLMGSMPEGSMLSIPLPEAEITGRLEEGLSVAVLNAVDSSVVSGSHAAIDRLEAELRSEGIEPRRLRTSHAFHSSMMDPILDDFRAEVARVSRAAPEIPFVSNVTGAWITEEEARDPDYWARQLRSAVRFSEGLETIFRAGPAALVEVGPGKTLATLARMHPERDAAESVVESIRHPKQAMDDQAVVISALGELWTAGVRIDWEAFHAGTPRGRLPLPTYPFQREEYWLEARPLHGPGEIDNVSFMEETGSDLDGSEAGTALNVDTLPRPERLEHSLRHLFATLAGFDPESLDTGRTFLELGFESLSLTQACARLRREFSVDVALPRLQDDLASIGALAGYLDAQLPKEEEAAPRVEAATQPSEPAAPPTKEPRSVPMTVGQQEIFLASIMSEDRCIAYNQALMFRLRGSLDAEALHRALQALVDRHESLRSVIDPDDLTLTVQPDYQIPLPTFDLGDLDASDRAARVAEITARDASEPFSMDRSPLVRTTLVRAGEEDHLLLLTVHHVVADGWSCGLMVEELAELYSAEVEGRDAELSEHAQWVDYIEWYESTRSGEAHSQAEDYWLGVFGDSVPVLELPTSRPRPALQTFEANRVDVRMDPDLVKEVRELAAREGVTLFTALLTAFEVTLARVSGSTDLVVGMSVAGQATYGVRSLVGHCVDFLPLRFRPSMDEAFADQLQAVKATVADGIAHQTFSFGALLPKLELPRDPSRPSLVSVVFNMGALRPVESFGDARADVRFNPETNENFELFANVVEAGDTLEAQWTYNTSLFDRELIEEFIACFQGILRGAVADPQASIGGLPLLSGERTQVLDRWNDTARDYTLDRSLHSLVEEQVARTPDAIAVRFRDQELTYRELDRRAAALAAFLQSRGVEAESLVGVFMERSVEMVVALLAILKAGGAYVPLDPDYPPARLTAMLEDANVPVVLTQGHLANGLAPVGADAEWVAVDVDWPLIEAAASSRPLVPASVEPTGAAYVIFTSGSTGRPKGVVNTHRGIVNRLVWMQEAFGMTGEDRVLQKTPFSFDVSVWEFFWPLMTGARLVVAEPGGHGDPDYLVDTIRREGITTIHFVPSMLQAFLGSRVEACGTLERIICSGEALPAAAADETLERLPSAELYNLYGPTEAAVDVTWWRCVRGAGPTVPIGRPVANTRIHILDRYGNETPVGVAGELHIGGVQVARGYVNRPELTAERFIADPFSSDPGAQLYRTGDLAYWRFDGSIEYLGRLDDQVKIRGFRIELGEIEARLREHDAVRECAVILRTIAGDPRIVAYVVGQGEDAATGAELRDHLARVLPEYMVPQHYVEIERIPLSPNGKVDRKALAGLATPVTGSGRESVPPQTEMERLVAAIWAEVLDVEDLGVDDSFFDLGGHSLLALRVVRRLNETAGSELPLRTIFDHDTVRDLAQQLERHQDLGSPLVEDEREEVVF